MLEARLALEEQKYIALPDRPTLADISYFPFSMPWMFGFFGVDINNWPNIKLWGEVMMARPAIQKVMATAPSIGH